MLVEDTYSSEEMVDQQPVLVKVMDTADQVMIYSMLLKLLLKDTHTFLALEESERVLDLISLILNKNDA